MIDIWLYTWPDCIPDYWHMLGYTLVVSFYHDISYISFIVLSLILIILLSFILSGCYCLHCIMHEHLSLYTYSLGRFWRPWIRTFRTFGHLLISCDRTLREELEFLPIWFWYYCLPFYSCLYSLYNFTYILNSLLSLSSIIMISSVGIYMSYCSDINYCSRFFITCSGYFRLSVYTWGILLVYIRRRLSSRLPFHVFWEAGHDITFYGVSLRNTSCDNSWVYRNYCC